MTPACLRQADYSAHAGGFFVSDEGWTANWSYARIAQKLGLHRDTVRVGLGQLRETGFLSVESGLARRPNKITMTFPLVEAFENRVIPFSEHAAEFRSVKV